MVKGTGIDLLWPQVLALLMLGVVLLALASIRFRKTVA